MFCSLLSTTARASDLVIDITNVAITQTITSLNLRVGVPNTNNAPVTSNILGITNPVRYDLNLADVDGTSGNADNNIAKNHAALSQAIVNARVDPITDEYLGNNVNLIDFDPTDGLSDAEALVGSLNINSGIVSATLDTIDMSADADDVTNGAVVGVNNNSATSFVVINGQDNYVTGDASSHAEVGPTVSDVGYDATNDVLSATGDIVIAAFQRNTATGTATARTQNINMSVSVANLGVDADDTSSLVINGNDVLAINEVNHLSNIIDLAHSGVALQFATAAYQDNLAAVSGIINLIDMTMVVTGTAYGDMTTSNNNVYSYSRVNTLTNQAASDSGGEEFGINSYQNQNNSGAVSDTVTNVDMFMTAALTSDDDIMSGDMSISNNNVASFSRVNVLSNQLVGDSGVEDGHLNLALYQTNSGVVSDSVSFVDMSMEATTATTTAPMSGDMSVMNNSVSANALASSMYNDVEFGGASDNSSTLTSRIRGLQSNTATIMASVSGVDMSVTVPGTTTSSVATRGNTVSATAAVNSAVNIVRLR